MVIPLPKTFIKKQLLLCFHKLEKNLTICYNIPKKEGELGRKNGIYK